MTPKITKLKPNDVANIVEQLLETRAGEKITPELAVERARNIAAALSETLITSYKKVTLNFFDAPNCVSCGSDNILEFDAVDAKRCVRCQEIHDEEVRQSDADENNWVLED
jgi:hypothetical protein